MLTSNQLVELPTSATTQAPLDIAIGGTSDLGAISAWLVARGGRSQHTFNAYRREATKLLLWLQENGLSLLDMKVEHVHDFFRHLGNPPEHWLRPRKARRDQVLQPTQVLFKPLDARSIAQTRTILGQMAAYLQEAGYLQRNVFRLSIRPAVIAQSTVTRHLDFSAWDFLWTWIQHMPQGTNRQMARATRARWLFALLYHTGMRREEVAKGVMGDFVNKDGHWVLRVVGKGFKERFVTVNSALFKELLVYRKAIGCEQQTPTPSEKTPLVASVNKARELISMSPRAIGMAVSEVAKQAANDCTDEHIQVAIEAMSTHWMRHTNATHRLTAGASLETTQDELGHSSINTTRIYAKACTKQREDDAELLAAFRN